MIRKQLIDLTENIEELSKIINGLDFKSVHEKDILKMDVEVLAWHDEVFKGLDRLEQMVLPRKVKAKAKVKSASASFKKVSSLNQIQRN